MLHKTLKTLIVSGSLLIGTAAIATEKAMDMDMTNHMSMMDMMGKSNMNCMATSDTLDKVLKTFQDALKSDDKTKMKSALVLAEQQIVGMKSHMDQCMNMMATMGTMMDSKEKTKMDKTKPTAGMQDKKMKAVAPMAPEKKVDSVEHEKHHSK